MTEELNTLYARMERLLKKHPETRDCSAAELVLRYWCEYDGQEQNAYGIAVFSDRYKDLTPPDNITRFRRMIQNGWDGSKRVPPRFQPTSKVAEFRENEQVKWLEYTRRKRARAG